MEVTVSREESPFTPVYIVFRLDTQQEVDMLYEFMGMNITVPEAATSIHGGVFAEGVSKQQWYGFISGFMQNAFNHLSIYKRKT